MTALVTEEMRERLSDELAKLAQANPGAEVKAWWDLDSLLTPTPRIKTQVIQPKEKNG